ncbi:enoyl-CoA hydratase [Rhodococcoides trifolii]|uniref:Enoyl-CoA hydratase n=1 Tax=Rhodococcoides trifolii TaxID=908250 RepID=A0A917FQZ6_9NOCA|nr:enoyl-CoA hydratase family protein [Rhodococcus trifolii]GGF96848.1 enoyl-CoA hydratase [Rhodococcus trifolii]
MAVKYEVADGAATLTLDSPSNRNALSSALVGELLGGLEAAIRDSAVRAIVLTHTGGTFCAGADLTEAGSSPEQRTQQMVDLLRAVVECPKPVVGVIDGHVRAGGMGLVGACDIVVSGPASTFALTEARLGLAASIVSLTLLPRLTSRAAGRYFLTGEKFGPEKAEAIGLVSDIAPDPHAAAAEILNSLRKASPQGLSESKALTTRSILADFDSLADELAATSARLFASDEAREGMMSFLEKRSPRWSR